MRYYKPDIEKARKLMADAGQASGFTVKLLVIPTFPTMISGAVVVAANLKRIGITAEIENVEYAVWIKRWLAKDFDLTMNITPGYADPDTAFFRALHSTKGQNWNSWSVPEIDALLEMPSSPWSPWRASRWASSSGGRSWSGRSSPCPGSAGSSSDRSTSGTVRSPRAPSCSWPSCS